jgi:hypothetical protein
MPDPLNYATPDLRFQLRDRVITITTSLQIVLACFLCVLGCMAWAAMPVGSPAGVIFELLEILGYGIASMFALAGSVSRFAERRRWLYWIYAIAFPVLVGAFVIGMAVVFASQGNSDLMATLIFAVVFSSLSLIANPALVVMAVRWLRREYGQPPAQ